MWSKLWEFELGVPGFPFSQNKGKNIVPGRSSKHGAKTHCKFLIAVQGPEITVRGDALHELCLGGAQSL